VAQRGARFYAAMVLVLAGAALASRAVEPSRLPNVCLVDMWLGLPCITTGLTRAFHAMSLGQLRPALAYHPLSLLLYMLLGWHLILACLRLLGWRYRLIRMRSDPVPMMIGGTIGLLTACWIPRVLAIVLGL
jgi:hypothetical protein